MWLFLHCGSRGIGNRLASATSRSRGKLCEQRWITPPGSGPRLPRRGRPRVLGLHPRPAVGAALRAAEPRRDDGPGCACLASGQASTVDAEEAQLPPQLHRAGEALGKGAWLSRKGAIDASAGKPGLIPGSMGTAPMSWKGAGTSCRSTRPRMAQAGTTAAPRPARRSPVSSSTRRWRALSGAVRDAFLDEIPGAYKPIDTVMADAADLVEVRHTLRQIVNVKGD